MNTTELLGVWREEVSDLGDPYLWSDTLVYGYIDDAQKWFCRLTYGIEDARSFRLNITVNKFWYVLDPRILKVRDSIDSVTGSQVPVIATEKMRTHGLRFDGSSGPIKALISGLEKGKLRACPVPSVASTVELHTFRLPDTVGAGSEFEIDEQHHRGLLLWVKHRAYDVQDSEMYDKRKSMEFEARFRSYCAAAKAEQDRLNRPVSTVVYGGL